jgi:Holliday junction resolvase-like predicted endonuclease
LEEKPYVYENEWFEETNVLRKIREYLEAEGWEILKANEDKTQKGEDIRASKNDKTLVVEVKGYPSDKYVKTTAKYKAGEKKPTKPKVQAGHWFAEALFELEIRKSKEPNIQIALGLPLMKRYQNLLNGVEYVKDQLRITCYFSDENGKVSVVKPGNGGDEYSER